MKKIVFMGTPNIAAEVLNHLHKNSFEGNYKIVAAYCQPDRPAGRGNKLQAPAVKQEAEKLNIPIYQPVNFKEQDDIDILKSHNADALVVIAYGLILPQAVLDITPLGAYNIHASLLPQWRGAAPVQRAIMAGDNKTGITIMKMDKGLDTGDILLQKAIPIAHNETSQTLFDALSLLGGELMFSALKQILDMRAAFIPQNNANATYAHKILKEEYILDWNTSAIEIDRKVRGLLTPRAILNTKKDPSLTVQVLEGKVIEIEHKNKAGEIILAENNTLIIATKDDNKAYQIEKIKPSGKNVMAIKDFINGYL